MEHVGRKIEELRAQDAVLREDRTPIDVFAFLELELGLDPIPFDDLTAKYRTAAAIKADFTGIYLDAEQYELMEQGPDGKLNRLRFTVDGVARQTCQHRPFCPKPTHAGESDQS